jgi:ABC-type uncharacterized transport system ATPase component
MTVVIVTHENDIATWARRKLLFRDGEIVQDVLQPPRSTLPAQTAPSDLLAINPASPASAQPGALA